MNEISITPFKRFPDFGKEVRRKIPRKAECYDCVKFYKKCKGQKVVKGKSFDCTEYKWLPRIKAG